MGGRPPVPMQDSTRVQRVHRVVGAARRAEEQQTARIARSVGKKSLPSVVANLTAGRLSKAVEFFVTHPTGDQVAAVLNQVTGRYTRAVQLMPVLSLGHGPPQARRAKRADGASMVSCCSEADRDDLPL